MLCFVYGDGGDDDDDDDDSDHETGDDNADDDDDDDDDDDERHLGPSWSVLESSWSPLEALLARPGLQASWMPHFFEDVSGESLIFNIERLKTKLSTSHFLEDVSGETPIFNIKRLKTIPPNIPIF